jgi:hypothetical protein
MWVRAAGAVRPLPLAGPAPMIEQTCGGRMTAIQTLDLDVRGLTAVLCDEYTL